MLIFLNTAYREPLQGGKTEGGKAEGGTPGAPAMRQKAEAPSMHHLGCVHFVTCGVSGLIHFSMCSRNLENFLI